MTPFPRGTCPVCHRLVPVRVNGAIREHRPWARNIAHPELLKTCEGSGQPAEPIGIRP